MRQVLVEAARRRMALKRQGDDRAFATVADNGGRSALGVEQVLSLNRLLDELEDLHLRPHRVVELRFFGGYSQEEIAGLLDMSPSTVDRDWRFARAWLESRLEPGPPELG